MILTAHQPVYLPWLGFFHKVALADRFVSLDSVQYATNDWINRNKIMESNGPAWLTIPCLKSNHLSKKICEIEIDPKSNWGRKHWTTIRQSYGKAPFFRTYADFFEDAYSRDWKFLSALNLHMLKWFLDQLDISRPVDCLSSLNVSGDKNDLLIGLCSKVGATAFIFGALGRDYADEPAFEAAGIKPIFQDYVHPSYPQTKDGFASHLSVVDLLFNCGPDSLEILMTGNLDSEKVHRA